MVQCEDGYTKIANELLDAILRYPLTKREHIVVLAVIRKTYGWNKKKDDMSLSQLADITGIDRAHLSRTVNGLFAKKVLLKEQGRYAQTIGLNKKYRDWVVLPKEQPRCQKSNRGVAKRATEVLPKEQPQKTTPKDNTKRQKAASLPSLWDLGEQMGIPRSLMGKQAKHAGNEKVESVIASMLAKRPADPQSYFVAATKEKSYDDFEGAI